MTSMPFKIWDRVKIKSTEQQGVVMNLPNPYIAWIKQDHGPLNYEYGVPLTDLELIVEEKQNEFGVAERAQEKYIKSPMESIKKDDNKYDPTMLTLEMVELVSRVRMFGAKKYARNNFKITGFKYTRSLAAALRHINAFLDGQDNDEESGLCHLGHAICCLEHLIYDMKHHPLNDDRYKNEK